jgi:hypothetical protein
MKKSLSVFILMGIIIIISFACKKDPVIVEEDRSVLIIYDDTTLNVNTQSLKVALEEEGFIVSFSQVNESRWDNTNPPLTGFYGVIHLNGTSYDYEMPLAGQNALVDFVQNRSGYFVSAEWNSYQISEGEMLAMRDLILLDRGNPSDGELTYTVVPEQAGHPVMDKVASSFLLEVDANGTAHQFSSQPSVVIMKEGTRDAVLVREYGNGRILGFHHSGNYVGYASWSNPNIQKIIINFFNWE